MPSAPADNAAAAGSDADLCDDLFVMAGIGPVCPRGPGLFEVYSPEGDSIGFTHGGDPCSTFGCDAQSDGGDDLLPLSGTTPHCVSAVPNTYYVHVIYARAFDDADRYATMLPSIRALVANANALVDAAGQATGSGLDIKVLCNASGQVVVENLVLNTTMASASFSTIVSNIRAWNASIFNDAKKKYWVYYDDAGACSCAGTGHIYFDDSPGVTNNNNGNAGSMYAVSFNSNSTRTWLHELGHNLGAVQDSAPYSSLAGHCIDGRDTMCYNDGGANSSGYSTSYCATEVFDCNKNTYCHANPAAGSYLATKWNVCGVNQRFLFRAGTNLAPVMQSLSCTPAAPNEGQTVTCSFHATDGNNDNLSYSIRWGDGSASERVPASGFVANGTTRSATHVYAAGGSFVVSVNATDDRSPALTSAFRNLTLVVNEVNGAPILQSLSCTTATLQPGGTATCTFNATDDNTGVRYRIEWGDGQTSFVPSASGYVAPGATLRNASHAYAAVGNYTVNVTATDNATTPLTSNLRTATVRVANSAPVMQTLSCTTSTIYVGDIASCSFNATDDSTGVRYRIEWGDGQVSDVPTSGYAAPGPLRFANHSYASAGNFTVRVTATDNVTPSATSAARTATVRVIADTTPPTVTLTDPVDGYLYYGCGLEEEKPTPGVLFVQKGCVRAIATDNTGVTRLEVYTNGVFLASDGTAPYEMEFLVQETGLGASYQVRAYDRFNNIRYVTFMADGIAPV